MFLIPTGRRSPSAQAVSFNRLNRLMDDVLGGLPPLADFNGGLVPAADITEDDKALSIALELTGVAQADVKLSLKDDVLTVTAEKKQESEEQNDKRYRFERSFGTYRRRFTVPHTVEVDGIDASHKDGVLTIVLPKSERARSREIEVKG